MAIPRIKPQYLWAAHFFAFFVYLGFLTSNALPFSIADAKWLTVIWVGIVILHTLAVFGVLASGSDAPRKRDEEKPKRHLELADDGELVEVDDDVETDEQHKQLTGNHLP